MTLTFQGHVTSSVTWLFDSPYAISYDKLTTDYAVIRLRNYPAKTLTLGIRWANVSATMNIYTTLGQHKSKCVAQQPSFPPFANRSLLPYND